MSRYPVPIFQPTVPLEGSVPLDWLERIQHWMNQHFEKNEEFRRQLETQNHLLVQLNRRLDRVFLKLATLETDKQTCKPSEIGCHSTTGGLPFGRHPQQITDQDDSNRRREKEVELTEDRPRQHSVAPVSSWQQQREAMLKCLVAQMEIEDSLYPGESIPGQTDCLTDRGVPALPTPNQLQSDIPVGQLEQVEALKEQLHAAIREMEVECSVQRAKLSHERARLEAREVELDRRERKLAKESREQKVAEERAEPLISRIKGMIRRGG